MICEVESTYGKGTMIAMGMGEHVAWAMADRQFFKPLCNLATSIMINNDNKWPLAKLSL